MRDQKVERNSVSKRPFLNPLEMDSYVLKKEGLYLYGDVQVNQGGLVV